MKLVPLVLRTVASGVLVAAILLGPRALLAAPPADSETSREITYLMTAVHSSPSTFIRNGTTHPGPAAADHMKAKADYYRNDIKTAEDFIRLAATKSALTGALYLVRHPDGMQEPCGVWLTRLLQTYRAKKGLS